MKTRFPMFLIVASVIFIAAEGCRTRDPDWRGKGGARLKSRAPYPGETNGRDVMDATTFVNTRSLGSDRGGLEAEVVQGILGLSAEQIQNFAGYMEPGSTRPAFKRLAKPSYPRYFTLGSLNLDLVPWTDKAHEAREASPYLLFRIENDRVSYNTAEKKIEISVGTDYMIDTYYDTPDFVLLGNGISARQRIRQDNPGVGRRVLLQTKILEGIDPNGLKRARKRDVRFEMSTIPEDIWNRLDRSVKSGKDYVSSSSGIPMPVFAELYSEMSKRNLLPDLDGKSKVLLLNPQAVVFSERARYHMRRTPGSVLRQVYDWTNIQLAAITEAATASTTLDAASKDQIISTAKSLSSKEYIAEQSIADARTEKSDISASQILAILNLQGLNDKALIPAAHKVFLKRRQLFQEFSAKSKILGPELDIARRKLEASGSFGLALWFESAVVTYGETLPSTDSDLLIDSFDYVRAVTFDDYKSLTPEQKQMSQPLPMDKVFFASITSDAQIELTGDITFEACIKQADSSQDPQILKAKDMCIFLLKQLSLAQVSLMRLRGEEVEKMMKDANLGSDAKWAGAEAAKGENVLRIARDMPAPLPTLPPMP